MARIAYYAGAKLPEDPFADYRTAMLANANLRDLRDAYPDQPVGGPDSGAPPRRFVLMSFGPDTDGFQPTLRNPARGPFIAYDLTNGTVSRGDLFAFGGGGVGGH